MGQDYYELLGVARDATTDEIMAAYREQIKKAHPDVSDDASANERTKQLIEAKDVLTDEADRKAYDRVGHKQFVEGVSTDTATSQQTQRSYTSTPGSQQRRQRTNTRNTAGQQRTARENRNTARRDRSTRQNSRRTHQRNARHARATDSSDHRSVYQTWDSEQSYAVGEEPEIFDLRSLIGSQQAIVFLGTTFVIYPILLIGALLPAFPTAANVTIAMCMVMVIAFLQSMPEVGILVFGTWVVLFPIIAFGMVGVSPFSLFGVLILGAVLFPFGLSLLSYIAINPEVLS